MQVPVSEHRSDPPPRDRIPAGVRTKVPTATLRRSALAIAAALAASHPATLSASGGESELTCARIEAIEAAIASGREPFNPETAQRPDHLAPPRPIDMEHIHITGRFANLRDKVANFDTMLVFTSMRDSLRVVELDALGFQRVRVELLSDKVFPVLEKPLANPYLVPKAGTPEFYYNGKRLAVRFDPPLAKGQRVALRVSYDVQDSPEGLHWIVPEPDAPDQRPEVWSQGQAEDNRYWIPCIDYPNDMATSEQLITVSDPNIVVANGDLISMTPNNDGTSTWHYRMDAPHVSYLISTIVGQFAKGTEKAGEVQLEYYLPPDRADDVMTSFRSTPAMIEFFGERLGVPYPYSKYAQTCVQHFTAGGMENISATTMNYVAMIDRNILEHGSACGSYPEGLISHELGHQWFGDLVTCRNWTHLWLNEGWASYCSDLWEEHACGRDMYDYSIWRNAAGISESDRVEDPRALVYVTTPTGGGMFGFKGSLVYDKGSYVLHMLREHVGTDAFFAGVKTYLETNRHQPVVTEDFREAIENASNMDLEGWFRQWCYTPGTPAIGISMTYDLETHEAVVTMTQAQKTDEATPAFFGDLRMHFREADGTVTEAKKPFAAKRETFRVPLKTAPVVFAPDPNGAILKGLALDVPTEVLIETAKSGPTAFARLDAIRALRKDARERSLRVLGEIALQPSRFYGEREQAIETFRDLKTPEALAVLATLKPLAKDPDYRIRKAIANAFAAHTSDIAGPTLLALASDKSDTVAREALEALGRQAGVDAFDALKAGFGRTSNLDRVRQSAISGLVDSRDPRAVDLIATAATPRNDRGTRHRAIDGLGTLLEFESDEVKARHAGVLMDALKSRDEGVARRAAAALGRIRHRPARQFLQILAIDSKDDSLAQAAKEAIVKIDSQPPAAIPSGETHAKVLELERIIKQMQEEIDRLDGRKQREKVGENGTSTNKPEEKKKKRK